MPRTASGRPPAPSPWRCPCSVRVPVGHGYLGVENPAGINGWYLVADGGPTPYRLKLRTASFGNARSLAHALPGTALGDVDLAMMSYLLVQGTWTSSGARRPPARSGP